MGIHLTRGHISTSVSPQLGPSWADGSTVSGMARVVTERQGPERGTVIPDPEDVRLYSGDEDVTSRYVVDVGKATGMIWVRATPGGPPVTAFSLAYPTRHALRHPVEAPWFPWDGCELGLGPIRLTS